MTFDLVCALASLGNARCGFEAELEVPYTPPFKRTAKRQAGEGFSPVIICSLRNVISSREYRAMAS